MKRGAREFAEKQWPDLGVGGFADDLNRFARARFLEGVEWLARRTVQGEPSERPSFDAFGEPRNRAAQELQAQGDSSDDEREALIEQATWVLIEYDTDTADRGVSDEHYRERRADVERVFPLLFRRTVQGEPLRERIESIRAFLTDALAESDADEREGGSGWDVEVDARTVLRLLDGLDDRQEPIRSVSVGATVQGEPSDEDEFAPGECDGSGTCPAEMHVHGCYRPHRADQCDAPDEYGHLPVEPQGEPSDAVVDAACCRRSRGREPMRTTEMQGSPRTDQRFVAEAVTETGVTLSGESLWEPSHWDQEPLRRAAVSDLRRNFKQADLLKVAIGPILVYRETRRCETVTTTYTSRKFYAEVAR